MHVERSKVIPKPRDEVVAYVADVKNLPEWIDDVMAVRVDGDEVRPGAIVHLDRIGPAAKNSPSSYEISSLVDGQELGLRGELRGTTFSSRFVFADGDGGTRVTNEADISLSGPMKLMSRVIAKAVASSFERDLASLERVLTEG